MLNKHIFIILSFIAFTSISYGQKIDLGGEWTNIYTYIGSSTNPTLMRDIECYDSLNCYICGYWGNSQTPFLLQTIDGCNTWHKIPIDSTSELTSHYLVDLTIIDNEYVLAVGYYPIWKKDYGIMNLALIMKYSNKDKSIEFTKFPNDTIEGLGGIIMTSNEVGMIYNSQNILTTTNAGDTWSLLDFNPKDYNMKFIHKIEFVDGIYFIHLLTEPGYSVPKRFDYSSIIIKSYDSLKTFSNDIIYLPKDSAMNASFYNSRIGYAYGKYKVGQSEENDSTLIHIFKTTNGGISWDVVYTRNDYFKFHYTGFYYVDSTNLVIYGHEYYYTQNNDGKVWIRNNESAAKIAKLNDGSLLAIRTNQIFMNNSILSIKNDEHNLQSGFINPNPASNQIRINLEADRIPNEYQIVNSLGIIQSEAAISSSQLALDISAYPAGLYFAVFEYADGTRQVEKFIKIRE